MPPTIQYVELPFPLDSFIGIGIRQSWQGSPLGRSMRYYTAANTVDVGSVFFTSSQDLAVHLVGSGSTALNWVYAVAEAHTSVGTTSYTTPRAWVGSLEQGS